MSAPPSTFFITDRRMLDHRCEWDTDHIERPARLQSILDLLESDGLLNQCMQLEPAECSIDELRAVHSAEYIQNIRSATELPDLETMEEFCTHHEDIYINQHSWRCALLSAGCALRAMQAVLDASKGKSVAAPNAFAAIRPPGHHASRNKACGFCLFNNVALCAHKARKQGVQRVLIVDWDVHAGQGTQYCDGDEGILLISAHRFDHGTYWPNLRESGIVHQYPNTINVPLNCEDDKKRPPHGDADYAALLHHLVLPIIHQWRPELVLVSCGFDAAFGDQQGEQEVTPAGFAYMTGLLAQQGVPLLLLLEGGYFLPSLAQGALYCMRALLQRAPPLHNFCQRIPRPDLMHTLYTNHLVHAARWPIFARWIRVLNALRARHDRQPIQMPHGEYQPAAEDHPEQPEERAEPYPTQGEYPPRADEVEQRFEQDLRRLMDEQQREDQKKRELLELELLVDQQRQQGELVLNRTAEVGKLEKVLLGLYERDQFLCLYFFVLLPLSFQGFDVRLARHMLPLQGADLAKLASKLRNGNSNNKLELELEVLDQFLAMFPERLEPYLLFRQ